MEKKSHQKLKNFFLEYPEHQRLYDDYKKNQSPEKLIQLNQAYSDFVNYTRLLSLIRIHVKYRSLHLKNKIQKYEKELVSEESLEYLVTKENVKESNFLARHWYTVLENDQLIDAVSTLSERQQQILWMLFVEDIPAAQAKEKLKVSQQSVSKTRKRALQNIEKLLEGKI